MRLEPISEETRRDKLVARQIEVLQTGTDRFQQRNQNILTQGCTWIREVQIGELEAALNKQFSKWISHFSDFLEPEFGEILAIRDEGFHALDVEPRTLHDQETFEIGMRFEEGLPGWDSDEKGSEKLESLQVRKRGAPGRDGSIIDAPTEIKTQGRQIRIEKSKSAERWGLEFCKVIN